MRLIAVSVTRPAAPTTMWNVGRRDSHQLNMPAVTPTSAGAGDRMRVRADTFAAPGRSLAGPYRRRGDLSSTLRCRGQARGTRRRPGGTPPRHPPELAP